MAELHFLVPPCRLAHYVKVDNNRAIRLEKQKGEAWPHTAGRQAGWSVWPASAGVCAAKETHVGSGEASSRPRAWSSGAG